MLKNELNSAVAKIAGVTAAQANSVIDALAQVITEQLKNGDKITVNGLGIFDVKDKAERQGVNPKTGEKITIAASKGVSFKAVKALKDALN